MKKDSYQDQHRYDDIIHLPHHVSTVHPPMPIAERAAQFSPFAALTGFEDAIRESGRLTGRRAELDEDAKSLLDEKFSILWQKMQDGQEPEIAVTYFVPDGKKDGGAYITEKGRLKKIDSYGRMLAFRDGKRISMGEIVGIEEIGESGL